MLSYQTWALSTYAWPAYYLFNEMRNTFHTC
ncbi:hypothetical protein T12_12149 [Trichinella patagoniensis]|uniref:Uncharacterized protein n=2 Tax=Trichinella TaxID=6333 RepID=A0A0V0Y977_9BILA|nr:hypothetical protein T12_12149 [Trichinella patagoniensis]KRY02511.1 hypothetical protein T01_6910 [Trichinella spiralis]